MTDFSNRTIEEVEFVMCAAQPRISLANLFWMFFRIGLLTFGGDVAMVAEQR